MLEEKIGDLTLAINQLSANLRLLTNLLQVVSVSTSTQAPTAIEPIATKPSADSSSEPELSDDEALAIVSGEKPAAKGKKPAEEAPINRADLQSLCLSLTRKDAKKYKPLITDIIFGFGGATIIKQVADKDLPALKAKLEELAQ